MDDLSILTAPVGFFFGTFVWSRVLRWVIAIWTVTRERARDPSHRSRWRIAATAFASSGPWTLTAMIILAVLVLTRTHAPAWDYFFYGVLASLVFQGIFMVWFMRKVRRRKAKEAAITS